MKYNINNYINKILIIQQLHLNFSSLKASILRFCIRFGVSHLACEVSIGLRCKYSASQRKLQSQIKGFRPKCLKKTEKKNM